MQNKTTMAAADSPVSSSQHEEELLDKIFQATELVKAQQYESARQMLTEVIQEDGEGAYGTMAAQSLQSLPPATAPEQAVAVSPPATRSGGIATWWSDLSFRNKLTVSFLVLTSLPVVILTQVLVQLTQDNVRSGFQESLQGTKVGLEFENVLWQQEESSTQAAALVGLVEAMNVDPRDPESVETQRTALEGFAQEVLAANEAGFPELLKNVRLLTNAQGQVVEQAVVAFTPAAELYHEPIANDTEDGLDPTGYPTESLSPPLGADLTSIPIVAAALAAQEPISGVELLSAPQLEQLGLLEAAAISRVDDAPATDLVETDAGPVGLVAMTVDPILRQGEVVGTAVVAAVFNRNSAIVDAVKRNYETPLVSIFAADLLVSTTLPDPGQAQRALGTSAPAEISSVLLDPDQETSEFFDSVTLNGTSYLVQAGPVLDHTGRPTGILMVGRQEQDMIDLLRRQQLVGYGIGGGILVVAWLAAFPLAAVFTRPIRRLAEFAQALGAGQLSQRMTGQARRDEIGILATEMNAMADRIEANVTSLQGQEEQQRRGREQMQQDVISLLTEIEGARDGDLTRRAPIVSGEVGLIGDAFNVTLDNLSQLVASVRTTTARVNSLAQNSEAVVASLAQAAQTQATETDQSLQLTVESTQEIASITTTSTEAATIAQASLQAAAEGKQAMHNTVTLYEQLQAAVGKTSKKVKRLVGSSQEINKVLSIIKDISDRTSLLAFNAVLEADRSGEQGFSSIADEIVELSKSVKSEVSQIERLARRIQEDTSEVAQAMEDSTGSVAEGTQLVQQTETILDQLAEVATQIDRYQQTILHQTQSHLQRSAQVEGKMGQVNQIAAQTSAQAGNVVTALRELLGEVEQLQQSVHRFRLSHD